MFSRMFRHLAFALMGPATNGCLERALLHVGVQLYQTAGQLLETLQEVLPAHEELASPPPWPLHAHVLVYTTSTRQQPASPLHGKS